MPLKNIWLTGKRPSVAPQLDAASAPEKSSSPVAAGQTRTAIAPTTNSNADTLFESLGSWSPIVRERAAMALARRKKVPIDPIITMIDSPLPPRPLRSMPGFGTRQNLLSPSRRRLEKTAQARRPLAPRQSLRSPRAHRTTRHGSSPRTPHHDRQRSNSRRPARHGTTLPQLRRLRKAPQEITRWLGRKTPPKSHRSRPPKSGRPRPGNHRRNLPKTKLRKNQTTPPRHSRSDCHPCTERNHVRQRRAGLRTRSPRNTPDQRGPSALPRSHGTHQVG